MSKYITYILACIFGIIIIYASMYIYVLIIFFFYFIFHIYQFGYLLILLYILSHSLLFALCAEGSFYLSPIYKSLFICSSYIPNHVPIIYAICFLNLLHSLSYIILYILYMYLINYAPSFFSFPSAEMSHKFI